MTAYLGYQNLKYDLDNQVVGIPNALGMQQKQSGKDLGWSKRMFIPVSVFKEVFMSMQNATPSKKGSDRTVGDALDGIGLTKPIGPFSVWFGRWLFRRVRTECGVDHGSFAAAGVEAQR